MSKQPFDWDMFAERVVLIVLALVPLFLSGFAITYMIVSPETIVQEEWVSMRLAALVLVLSTLVCTAVSGYLIHSILLKWQEPNEEVNQVDESEKIRKIKHTHRLRVSELVIIQRLPKPGGVGGIVNQVD